MADSGKKEEEKAELALDLSKCVMIDFGGRYLKRKEEFNGYTDLSGEGSYVEGMLNLYDRLRWAETHEGAEYVLITDFKHEKEETEESTVEHSDALFDRIFRATCGRRMVLG